MKDENGTYRGRCFCGAVEFTVSGEPKVAGYCHCAGCREWSAAPVNAFSLWAPEAVEVTKGADRIGVYNRSELSFRKYCTRCGGHLFTAHPPWNLVDVYAAVLPGFEFRPKVHVNYQSTVLHMKDGLPKFKDIPGEMGGTGELLPE
jgi:hypothetical protein